MKLDVPTPRLNATITMHVLLIDVILLLDVSTLLNAVMITTLALKINVISQKDANTPKLFVTIMMHVQLTFANHLAVAYINTM
jgi:hypothetical protein